MTPTDYYDFIFLNLEPLSHDAIITRFNQSLGLRTFGVARQGYLKALRTSLDERNIDYSAVGAHQTMRFDRRVTLVGKVILRK